MNAVVRPLGRCPGLRFRSSLAYVRRCVHGRLVFVFWDSGFRGKVVAVWAKEPAKGGVLENPHLRWLGHRAFLVGRMADDGKGEDPRAGACFWFPVDDLLMLTEFPDVQMARKAYAAREGKASAEGKSGEGAFQGAVPKA